MLKSRLLVFALFLFMFGIWSTQQSQAERPSPAPSVTFTPAKNQAQTPFSCALTAESSQFLGCHISFAQDYLGAVEGTAVFNTPCQNGMADIFPCDNIHLLSYLTMGDIGGGEGNDIWGWTDPQSGKEYAIMGRTSGTSFIDISDPTNAIYLGNLPTATPASFWRDIKTYQNYAYIVADSAGSHGMQVFDLTQLRTVTNPPVTFSATHRYTDLGSSHNLYINEESATVYALGNSTAPNQCGSGLHMIDIQSPEDPTFIGCYSNDGYIHDTQCVIYGGPDPTHQGKEICFNASVNDLTIIDVSDKQNVARLGNQGYPTSVYAHQGWLTDDHRYFLLNDEGDETATSPYARTYIWDVSDLEAPMLVDVYTAVDPAIDHNLYIHDGLLYEANYRSGLRVLTLGSGGPPKLNEVAYFDTFPDEDSDEAQFNGAWSVYPFFESGNIIVSTIEHGFFLLQLDSAIEPTEPQFQHALPMITTDSS